MSKLRKYYYDNKNHIWKIILIVAFFYIVIQILNYNIRKGNIGNNKISNNTVIENTNNNTAKENTIFTNNQSLVSGNYVEENIIEKEVQIIKQFFNYCNDNQSEKAYDLISDDCKKEFYKTLAEFEEKYLKNNFPKTVKKTTQIENWANNIYKISISDDIMSTGNLSGKSIQDYVTIVAQDGENKINLNSFIRKEEINKSIEQEEVKITVLNKKIYMEYEEYEIKVENNCENTILLDTMESTKSIYLLDNNNMKYYAQTHEILDKLLKVDSQLSTQMQIKFSKSYSTTRKIKSIVFSDIILNYNEYLNDKVEREKITVNFE